MLHENLKICNKNPYFVHKNLVYQAKMQQALTYLIHDACAINIYLYLCNR